MRKEAPRTWPCSTVLMENARAALTYYEVSMTIFLRAATFAVFLGAAFNAPYAVAQEPSVQLTKEDVAQLRAQLADQQKQIEQLRQALEAQQKLLDRGILSPAPSPAP